LQLVLVDPTHKEYNNMRDWIGLEDGDDAAFDPTEFDPKYVTFIDHKEALKEWETMGFR
jgi:Fe-S-cluster formation regulator IscX/YfhJ